MSIESLDWLVVAITTVILMYYIMHACKRWWRMRKRNSKTTITGQVRIKPFNLNQLEKLLETTKRPKEKDKIVNRIKVLKSRTV